MNKSAPAFKGVILGLDPGSLHTGYGFIESEGSRVSLLTQGRVSPRPEWPFPRRLRLIHETVIAMIREFKPKAAAIEGVFVYKNPASAFKLAQARGVILLAAALCDVPVFEYAPQLVKLALTGSGRAEKTQVAYMVGKILGLTEKISLDASDALSLAICHSGQSQMSELPGAPALGNRSRSSSWRRLRPQDLPALGFRVEAKSD